MGEGRAVGIVIRHDCIYIYMSCLAHAVAVCEHGLLHIYRDVHTMGHTSVAFGSKHHLPHCQLIKNNFM